MTLKQKIENLTWTDLIKKLKDILSNFSTKFDNLTGRVSTLESNSGNGGGNQNLQSVLDNGGLAIIENNTVNMLNGGGLDKRVSFDIKNGNKQTLFSMSDGGTIGQSVKEGNEETSIDIISSNILLTKLINGFQTQLRFPVNGIFASATYELPVKSNGIYTMATIEDINALGNLIPTYADNASAVTGGLAINHLYKTTLGEIRVRV